MANIIDVHIHFGAPSKNGMIDNGCYWSPKFEKTAAYWAFRLITGTMFKKIDYDCAKTTMLKVINTSTRVDKFVFLAIDQVYDKNGAYDLANWTNLYVQNSTIVGLAEENSRILLGASVHPYRLDWEDELDYCIEKGAVLCKWLPSAQGIDFNDQLCVRFYKKLANHNLPLLCHVGPELSIPARDEYFNQFNNALYLRRALDEGVPVIFAHCSLPFEPALLDDDAPFQEFLKVMKEAHNNGRWKVYADLSALCLLRSTYVPFLLSLDYIEPKQFLLGSDYPIPMIDISYKKVPTAWDWVKRFWETILANNMLDKNLLLLEGMGFTIDSFTAADALFAQISR